MFLFGNKGCFCCRIALDLAERTWSKMGGSIWNGLDFCFPVVDVFSLCVNCLDCSCGMVFLAL